VVFCVFKPEEALAFAERFVGSNCRWLGGDPEKNVGRPERRARFAVQDPAKLRHRGVLWGLYVWPEARGTGLAAALEQPVVADARPLVEQVRLTVVASNVVARRLCSAAGFEEYRLERWALKVGSEYFDEVLMALPLNPRPEPATRD
jgi:GNAT superfamily N-acetyltransferase